VLGAGAPLLRRGWEGAAQGRRQPVTQFLGLIGKLFAIEAKAAAMTPVQR
jgi:hypothetical protein